MCDGETNRQVYGGRLRTCHGCGHVWAAVDAGSLPALYGHDYFHGAEYGDYLGERPALERNFRRRLAVMATYLDPQRHRRLLEIGCAYGLFLNQARGRFERVTGIDVADEGLRFARGQLNLEVWLADLPAAGWQGEQFDVVCAWDTIEHLAQPGEHLRVSAELMPPGGLLALTTGDIGSLNARWRGGRWRLIHPPTHVHYFSLATVSRLLDRHGFDVVHADHPGAYRSVGSMLHNVAVGWGWPRLGRWLAGSRLGRAQVYLNLFDVMFVIARRRPV